MQQTPITDSQSKVWNKNTIIFLADMGLFFILLNILPFEPAANKGLALLAFVAILWLTEAVKCHHHGVIRSNFVSITRIGK